MRAKLGSFWIVGVLGIGAAVAPGCTCTTIIEDDDDGSVQPSCFVDELTPGFGAEQVEVVGAKFIAHYTLPLDPASLEDQVQLVRLDDQANVEIDVALVDPQTIEITPTRSLRFWGSYGLNLGAGVRTVGGEDCGEQSSAFTTVEPTADMVEARPAPITGSAIVGNHAIVISSSLPGIQVYDISAPDSPVLVATSNTPSEPHAVRVLGNRAYVTLGFNGTQIYDLVDPSKPTLVGTAGTPGVAFEAVPFERDGRSYLAVADGWAGLAIIDVTEPANPVTTSTLYFGPAVNASRISLSGSVLAVALEDAGFALVDLAVLGSPSVIAQRGSEALPETFNAPRKVVDVLLEGSRLYAAVGGFGIQSFEVQGPTVTFVDHAVGPDGLCESYCSDVLGNLSVSEGTVFATSFMSGAIRVSDDGAGNFSNLEVLPVSARANALSLNGGYVFVGTDSGLEVRTETQALDAAPIYSEAGGWGIVRGVTGVGATVYAASQGRGLLTLDAETLAIVDVDETDGQQTDFGAFDVFVHDGGLFFSDARAGFATFDISDPNNPLELAQVRQVETDLVDGATFDGSVAFICDGNSALRSFDLSDPSQPVQLGTVFLNASVGGCNNLTIGDGVLYVAGSNGLGVVDAADPTALFLAKLVVLPAHQGIGGVRRHESTLYAATRNADWEAGTDATARRLVAFDISVPGEPVLVYTSDDLGVGGRLAIRSDKLYVSGNYEGVFIFDLLEPTRPELEGIVAVPGNASGLHFTADTLFVAGRGAGIIPIFTGRNE